jgi:hypothetical protein
MESLIENYSPLSEDIKSGTTRKVYSYVPLEENEEQAIKNLKEYMEKYET